MSLAVCLSMSKYVNSDDPVIGGRELHLFLWMKCYAFEFRKQLRQNDV